MSETLLARLFSGSRILRHGGPGEQLLPCNTRNPGSAPPTHPTSRCLCIAVYQQDLCVTVWILKS